MKNSFYTYQLILILGIGILGINLSVAQEVVKIKKAMTQLEPDNRLIKELKTLINKEKGCDYYSSSLIWSIGINEIKESCILNISMQKDINKDHQYLGYFYIDKTLFVVTGLFNESLFSSSGKEEIEFTVSKKSKSMIVKTDLEDYSSWIYLFKDGILSLKKEYLLPCN